MKKNCNYLPWLGLYYFITHSISLYILNKKTYINPHPGVKNEKEHMFY